MIRIHIAFAEPDRLGFFHRSASVYAQTTSTPS